MFHLSTLDDFAIREEVEIVMPERERVYQRWAPDLLVEGDTLWISYAMGRVDRHGVEWPTFRLYGAKAKIPAKGEAPRITFTGEREIVVLDTGKFQGAGDYGIIDPEIFRNSDGQLYLYYNVVLHGIPGKRWRTGPICSQRMRDPWTPYGQGDEKLAWAGDAGPPDAGVAESPSIIKREKDYLMFYSARPSDKDQCIVMLRSKVPHGDAWKDRRVVMSTRTEDAPLMLAKASYERLGVGGQDALQYGGETYLIYQALGAESDGGHQTDIFRAAILKLPHEVIH
ncbi:family 43 glycosylhydrolase [Candidatus Sumerlaeota bacterium]|nr:family 43 glycosylhydrolase [Candidatus Sumerlaeota bacterium]